MPDETTPDPDEYAIDTLENCGKAFGFTLAAALQNGADLGTRDGRNAFADSIDQLLDAESFTPDVGIVMMGISAGLRAFGAADIRSQFGKSLI